MKLTKLSSALLGICIFTHSSVVTVNAETAVPYKNETSYSEQQVEELLAQLTLEEKITLLAGGDAFSTAAIERLGIPSIVFSDGPAGVRDLGSDPTLAYPVGIALGSTWNTELVNQVSAAIGRDARARKVDLMLAPAVNIQRTPLAGRNFEQFSEDPYLSGKLGAAYVVGLQSEGVGSSAKHFVGNEQELERGRGSSNIGERALRELYLKPFEIMLEESNPWTFMAAYNRVNGTYMTEHDYLLNDVLRGEWGYDGVIMSDWGALHSSVSAINGGLTLEMPGPGKFFDAKLAEAVKHWQVEESVIDEAARRLLRLAFRTGKFGKTTESVGLKALEDNRDIALKAAEESIVLLKNDQRVLPLNTKVLRSVAVIGPNANIALTGGGGSSKVVPTDIVSPLESLREQLPQNVTVTYAKGVDNDKSPPPAEGNYFSTDKARKIVGLSADYFANPDFSGQPEITKQDTWFEKKGFGREVYFKNPSFSVKWTGYFWPEVDGEYEFAAHGHGNTSLFVDGKAIYGANVDDKEWENLQDKPSKKVYLTAGKPVPIEMRYTKSAKTWPIFYFNVRTPAGAIEDAVAAAKNADVALVFVGSSRTSETEGHDRSDMTLFGQQNALVEAVVKANPNTIVVLNSGGPVSLPWDEKVPTLLQAWFSGEEGSHALTNVLLGKTNPSGKLPLTFPKRIEDNPTYIHYSGGRDANYGEGVFVGYRYYDKKNIEPLYPFGHGLSYTDFAFSDLSASVDTASGTVSVSVKVKNTGRVAGQEVVQVYVGDNEARLVPRPENELRAFDKISLAPGETKSVSFSLTKRDFAYFDVHQHDWVTESGSYRISIGSSSRNLPVSTSVSIQ
ncbi:beta-D-glucoside glucohydrolase [Aestuariibacter sp. GS-14]|uniref:beta-glucosidase n=1 Tax=Aestuariibacter sp. GS-14 TaxID=2590670 RepID=UPI00112E1033|nr:beta-glucosidase [Aestuariibacter sp. GS-14]TPV59970.1 beta-D-glucoside glucohydrolase [Aestuariibacter sp. GS-14]